MTAAASSGASAGKGSLGLASRPLEISGAVELHLAGLAGEPVAQRLEIALEAALGRAIDAVDAPPARRRDRADADDIGAGRRREIGEKHIHQPDGRGQVDVHQAQGDLVRDRRACRAATARRCRRNSRCRRAWLSLRHEALPGPALPGRRRGKRRARRNARRDPRPRAPNRPHPRKPGKGRGGCWPEARPRTGPAPAVAPITSDRGALIRPPRPPFSGRSRVRCNRGSRARNPRPDGAWCRRPAPATSAPHRAPKCP